MILKYNYMHMNPGWIDLPSIDILKHSPYFQRAFVEVQTCGYLNLGRHIQDMTIDEMMQLARGINKLANNPSKLDAESTTAYLFVFLVAMGEGCPLLTLEEFKESSLMLIRLMNFSVSDRQGEGKALYDKFKMTGASMWDVFYVGNNSGSEPKQEGESA